MSEWKTIDSAPKDGTTVLLAGRYWSDGQGFMKQPLIGQWVEHNDRWEAVWSGWFGVRPTHWMPLPPPPSTT